MIEIDEEVTQYIVLRSDLSMSKGKIAAQAAHAAVNAVALVLRDGKLRDEAWLAEWLRDAHAKIALKADAATFDALVIKLCASGWLFSVVTDEGRTQIPAGSQTAIALQPLPRSLARPLVGHLALL